MKSYFSAPDDTKYLVPSKILTNPSALPNLICNGLSPIKVLYEMF